MVELVAKNYARAMFELSIEANTVEETGEELQKIKEIFSSDEDIVKFFVTPLVTKKEKLEILSKAFEGKVTKNTENLLKVVIENGRASQIMEILDQYRKMELDYLGIEEAVAITTQPLSEAQRESLVANLEKTTGKKIILVNQIDESILGGILVKVGEQELDGTVLGKLNGLKQALIK